MPASTWSIISKATKGIGLKNIDRLNLRLSYFKSFKIISAPRFFSLLWGVRDQKPVRDLRDFFVSCLFLKSVTPRRTRVEGRWLFLLAYSKEKL